MTLKEAIQKVIESGASITITRPGHDKLAIHHSSFDVSSAKLIGFTTQQLLADDWEVEVPAKSIISKDTYHQIMQAMVDKSKEKYREACVKANIPCDDPRLGSLNILDIEEVIHSFLEDV